MRILVTNDDGIHSPGLTALAKALSRVGDVWVVAPDRERTAVAHAVTLHKPLRVHQVGTQIYAVNGTPVDCVNLAVLKLLPGPPDLLVSGINKGVNLGDDVLYSGTVSAAMEGTILGVPSMAVSQEGQKHFYFDAGARYAVRIARLILKEGRTYYWIAGTRISWSRSKDADHEALEEGAVSLTPIHLDTTNHGALDRFRKWETVRRPNARRRAASSKPKGKQRS
jgi:5'-nucleotidase